MAQHWAKAPIERGQIVLFSPTLEDAVSQDHPVRLLDDPTQPVAEADWPRLPRNPQKQLAKSCFVYDSNADCYHCPQGRSLPFAGIQPETRNGQTISVRVYRCESCENCPLSTACRSPKSNRGRMIYRDQYEPLREEMAARMQTPEGRTTYKHLMA